MDQDEINSFQPGGTAYNNAVAQYGVDGANTLASAAATGDETQLQNAIEALQGNPTAQDASTADALASQLYNAPLSAPLDQLGTILTNTVNSAGQVIVNTEGAAENAARNAVGTALVSPGLLIGLAVVGIGVVFYFGGLSSIKKNFI